jgi:hypothetical protein
MAVAPGDWIAAGALLLSALVAYMTFGPTRAELRACRLDRADLRRRLELVSAAILATLAEDKRMELLLAIGEAVKADSTNG